MRKIPEIPRLGDDRYLVASVAELLEQAEDRWPVGLTAVVVLAVAVLLWALVLAGLYGLALMMGGGS